MDREQHRRMVADETKRVEKINAAAARNIRSHQEEVIATTLDEAFSTRYRDGPGGRGSCGRGKFMLAAPYLKSKINGQWVD
jgi:hypothetical protein